MPPRQCDLCGLAVRGDGFSQHHAGRQVRFCCAGCRMVYGMLLEAADAPDPSRFKETELYRRCVAAGVIPASEEDLGARLAKTNPTASAPAEGLDGGHSLTRHYRIGGMWCPACSAVIQFALERQPGIHAAVCDFATDRLTCRYDPARLSPDEIHAVVRQLGYEPLDSGSAFGSAPLRREWLRLIVCALLAANVMMLSWALYAGFFTFLDSQSITFISWPIALMATVVMVYGGGTIFRRAWTSLRAASPGMEVLITIGAGSAYLYSLGNLWAGSLHLYFDTASMLITLVLLGKMLEALARARARQDMEGFLALQPAKVRLCTEGFPNGRFVAIDQLAPGDHFRVETEEVVPADGRIVEGQASVDLSAVTGEPQPVLVSTGDTIVSGSRLLHGAVRVEARRVGDDALIGQMIAIVRDSLCGPTRIESRAQRTLALFVPLLVAIAATTAAVGIALGLTINQALVRAVTVLVIACPCTLGIAIPMARVVGIARAGRLGLLVRRFDVFDKAGRIDTVVLDKTGTVTHGRWSLEKVDLHDGMTEAQAIGLALGLERHCEHTAARAIAAYAEKKGIDAVEVRNVTMAGDGATGLWDAHEVKIGSPRFAGANPPPRAFSADGDQPPGSQVYLTIGGRTCAVLTFSDRLRDGMDHLVNRLGQKGWHPHLVSGDTDAATRATADRLAINHSRGGLLPQDKADYLQRLQREGRNVAMVGDGLNDAPAMARADLAVALQSAAPLAGQTADVILMRADPLQLLDLIAWSARVNAKVRQNLIWACVYNLIAIPTAIAGLLSPLIAVTAMLLSSLTVIGNTLLLTGSASRQKATPATG